MPVLTIEVTQADIRRGTDQMGGGPIEHAMRRAGFNFPQVALENMAFFPPGCAYFGPAESWRSRYYKIVDNPTSVAAFQERVLAHDRLEPFAFRVRVPNA